MPNKSDNLLFRPWKELRELQNRKLRSFINRHVYPFSLYYRNLFDRNKIDPREIKTAQDLQRIPFTSKKDFLDLEDNDPIKKNLSFLLKPDEGLIKRYLPKGGQLRFFGLRLFKGKDYPKAFLEKEYRPIFLTLTAGTTAAPISFLYTTHDLENLQISGRRIIDVFGVSKEERAVNVFPYAPHLAFWQAVFAGFSANVFILSTGGGRTLGTEGNINSILKVKPHFLIGVSSYIYHIIKIARERNLDLSFIERIALGASRVPKGFKRKIIRLLSEMGAASIKILGTYGFTEARSAWAECPTPTDVSSGYHTYPDKEIFEVINPETGEVKKEGEDGEIVYTCIDGRGTCVLRYRTGDLVKGGIIYSPCPYCKRTVPRISSDIERSSNIKDMNISKIKGALVNLNNLEHLLDDRDEIDEWQIEIVKRNDDPYEVDELILYVSLLKDINREDFMRRLNDEIFSSSEVSFNKINFVSRHEIQRRIEVESSVKAKKIVDRRI